MDYQKHYRSLIERSYKRNIEGYVERHHILPRCMGGTDDVKNLCILTPKEHFIAHLLLVRMYKESDHVYKLASAVNMMINNTSSGRRNTSRSYEYARMMYIRHHPCKQDHVKQKIRDSLARARYEGRVQVGPKVERMTQPCGCGCGEVFTKKITSSQTYIKGHATRVRYRDQSERDRQSDRVKTHISSLSDGQKQIRMQAAMMCDQTKRAQNISESKKGKSTNQKEIEIQKYGMMTDEEFEFHVRGRTGRIATRMRNRRQIYHDRNGDN